MPSSSKSLSDLAGSRVVVTGATNGIGMATAGALARAGVRVVLAVRDTDLGARRAREFGGDCEVLRLDLADLASVRAFVAELDGPVDALVNNAGMFPHQRRTTPDGFELGMGTNFLGPFALTNLLLPRISRHVVSVGSEGHRRARIDPADLDYRRTRWSAPRAYTGSKLAVMLWGLELDRRLRDVGSPVTSMLTDPGWAASNISNKPGLGALHRVAQGLAGVVGNDLDAGAAPTLHCLTEPVPPGSYVGVDGWWGLRGRPVLSGRGPHRVRLRSGGPPLDRGRDSHRHPVAIGVSGGCRRSTSTRPVWRSMTPHLLMASSDRTACVRAGSTAGW